MAGTEAWPTPHWSSEKHHLPEVWFSLFLFDKSQTHDVTLCGLIVTLINAILHAICTQANLLAKEIQLKQCAQLESSIKTPMRVILDSRLCHSIQAGLVDPKLAAATPLLSNKARVAVVHSHGRWFCWGLSQHGRSRVCRLSSTEEIKNRPDVVAGEETAFWALNNVPESSNKNRSS